jgi:GNAT superfamily N-acetyltransferase
VRRGTPRKSAFSLSTCGANNTYFWRYGCHRRILMNVIDAAASPGATAVTLRPMSVDVACELIAGRRPAGLRFAYDYPTEFTLGMAPMAGTGSPLGPWLVHRDVDDVVVGDIGGGFTAPGRCEIGYAIVRSCWGHGIATAAVTALVAVARRHGGIDVLVAHTPLDRPASGRVVERVGFIPCGELDDEHDGVAMQVRRWELNVG